MDAAFGEGWQSHFICQLTAMKKPSFWTSSEPYTRYDPLAFNLHGPDTQQISNEPLLGGNYDTLQTFLNKQLGKEASMIYVGDNYMNDCLRCPAGSISVVEDIEYEDGLISMPDYTQKWGSFFTDTIDGQPVKS